MGTCYLCGKQHVDYRRTVHTGRSNRIGYSSRGTMHTSNSNSYGLRTVCASCALSIDYQNKKNAGDWSIGLASIIVAISFFVFLSNKLPGIVGFIIGGLTFYIPKKIATNNAEAWYSLNKDEYVDEVDVANQQREQISQQIEEVKQKTIEAQEKLAQMVKIEESATLQKMSKTFAERLMKEKELLDTKIKVFERRFNTITIKSLDQVKELNKDLELQESDCEKTDKKIKKFCDDYIKQVKSITKTKELVTESINNIEKVKAAFSDNLNQFITYIKNTENQILKATLDISENKEYTCNNAHCESNMNSIESCIDLFNKQEINTSVLSQQNKKDPENKRKAEIEEYINTQLNETDIYAIQKLERMYFKTTSLAYLEKIVPSVFEYDSVEVYHNDLKKLLLKL